MVLGAIVPGLARAEDGCGAFDRALVEIAEQTKDGGLLIALAPLLSPAAVSALVRRAESEPNALGEKMLYAVGLSGQAEGLRLLHERPLPRALARPRAVAMFALGEGVHSTTVSATLAEASGDARAEIAEVLGHVRQPRARDILEGMVQDPDPRVRLAVGESLIGQKSARARKVLLDLSHASDAELASRAARALAESHFLQGALEELPAALQGRAAVRLAVKGHKDVIARARQDVMLADHEKRATAFAVMVVSPDETPATLETRSKKAVERYGPRAGLELKMAQALLGDTPAIAALEAADPAFQPGPALVLIAFAEAGRAHAQLPREQAVRLVSALSRWSLEEKLWGKTLDALAVVAGDAVLPLAKSRLGGPEGPGLASAFEVIGRAGKKSDVPSLIESARRPISTALRATALGAAARLCPR